MLFEVTVETKVTAHEQKDNEKKEKIVIFEKVKRGAFKEVENG